VHEDKHVNSNLQFFLVANKQSAVLNLDELLFQISAYAIYTQFVAAISLILG
jgi:hypothetical protein